MLAYLPLASILSLNLAMLQYLYQRQYCMIKMARRRTPEQSVAAPSPPNSELISSLRFPTQEPVGTPMSTDLEK